MKIRSVTLLAAVLAFGVALRAAESNALRQVQTIPLPNVEGRIDHMGVDVQTQRLFVAALGNNTLEVLDLRAGKRLTSITGLQEPQGVFFVPRENKLYVANGDDGTCRIFDVSSYKLLQTAHFQSDADNVRYDVAPNQTRETPSPPRGRGLRVGRWVSFARPKSRIFAWARVVTKMFAGLMSRCVIPFACAVSRASAI